MLNSITYRNEVKGLNARDQEVRIAPAREPRDNLPLEAERGRQGGRHEERGQRGEGHIGQRGQQVDQAGQRHEDAVGGHAVVDGGDEELPRDGHEGERGAESSKCFSIVPPLPNSLMQIVFISKVVLIVQ